MKERIRKVYNLAMNGVDGEKEAAQKLFDKLIKKYSFSLSDFENEEDVVSVHEFKFHGKEQEKLLMQVAYKVTNRTSFSNFAYVSSGRKCRTILGVECTSSQLCEIQFLFEFYTKLWEKEKKLFLRAFIQKHSIFGSSTPSGKSTELSDDEFERLCEMMSGLSDEEPLLQIEEK